MVWHRVGVGTFSHTNLQYGCCFPRNVSRRSLQCKIWVFAAVELRIPFVWDMKLCELVIAPRRFGNTCCFLLRATVGCLVKARILLLRWPYSPGWALAPFTIRHQSSRSLALSHHSFIPIFLRSVDTSSSHLIFGLPLHLVHTAFRTSFLKLRCLAFYLYDQTIVFFDIL